MKRMLTGTIMVIVVSASLFASGCTTATTRETNAWRYHYVEPGPYPGVRFAWKCLDGFGEGGSPGSYVFGAVFWSIWTIQLACVDTVFLPYDIFQIRKPEPRVAQPHKYGGGRGEPNDPYLIFTAEQMNSIGTKPKDWGKCFKLMADIDLSAFDGTDGRPVFNLIGHSSRDFTGVFDGGSHTISNFTCVCPDQDNIGLFRCIGGVRSGAGAAIEIKNLWLLNPTVVGRGDVGSLAGYVSGSVLITNCHVEGGTVRGAQAHTCVGGLIGFATTGLGCHIEIVNCSSTATVKDSHDIRGLIGCQ